MAAFLIFAPLLLQASASDTPPTLAEAQANRCFAMAARDPAGAVVEANGWIGSGGGWRARQCLGQAYAAANQFASAEQAFVAAAAEARTARQADWPKLIAQAGNAALAGGKTAAARGHFDTALAQPWFEGAARGLVHLDRARAAAAANDWPAARRDLDQATALVPQEPLAWLFSATLARRQGDLARAASDIAIAGRLAPQDAHVAIEAGNIAMTRQDVALARKNWQAAVALDAQGPAGAIAARRLRELDAAPAAEAATAPRPPGPDRKDK